MAQTQQQNSGFSLSPPADASSAAAAPTTTTTVIPPPGDKFEGTYTVVSDTSSRDLLIGGGILLVLFVGFFFAKNAYANTLVAKRVPPNKANAAGWWLFVFLASSATGVVLAAVNSAKFMTPLIIGPLAAVGLVSLVLMFVSGRK
jgi:hypothetical protein